MRRIETDCGGRSRTLLKKLYGPKGAEILGAEWSQPLPWTYNVPETFHEHADLFACGTAEGLDLLVMGKGMSIAEMVDGVRRALNNPNIKFSK